MGMTQYQHSQEAKRRSAMEKRKRDAETKKIEFDGEDETRELRL